MLVRCFKSQNNPLSTTPIRHFHQNKLPKSTFAFLKPSNSKPSSLFPTPSRPFCQKQPEEDPVQTGKVLNTAQEVKARREEERASRLKTPGFLNRVKLKTRSVMRDYKELGINFKDRNFSLMMWKLGEYFRRNYKRFKNTMKHLWHEVKKIGMGFKNLKDDVSYSIKTTKDTTMKQYGQYSYTSRVRIRQTWSDLFKFIPFSIFIIIPGLELLLPAWLVIFPNAIPSQFQSNSSKNKKLEELVQKQQLSAEKLMKIFPQRLNECLNEKEVLDEDKEKILELKALFKKSDVLTTDLLQYRDLFVKYLNFHYASPKVLLTASNLMSLQPITGLNTINNFLRFFKKEIPIDHPSVSWMTRRILFRELFMYMKKLRKDDSMLRYDEIEELDEATLNRVCFERGIPVSILSRNQKLRELKKWHTLSNLRNVPDTLLLYCRVIKFSKIKKAHDNFTDEYQILRRCPNEIYSVEKRQMFEGALAVDQLNSMRIISGTETKFTQSELENYAKLLNKLQGRFDDLNREIEMTYRLGYKMLDYVENSLIVDYHMECKQKELETEAPELAEKAKDIFGNEFYYNFPQDVSELKEDSKWVKKLNEKKHEIDQQLLNTIDSSKIQSTYKYSAS